MHSGNAGRWGWGRAGEQGGLHGMGDQEGQREESAWCPPEGEKHLQPVNLAEEKPSSEGKVPSVIITPASGSSLLFLYSPSTPSYSCLRHGEVKRPEKLLSLQSVNSTKVQSSNFMETTQS